MANVAELDAALNQAVLEGKAMEAFEQYYADDVVMQENNDPPTAGKDPNRERELAFFHSVAEFHRARMLASAVNGDVTFSEWELDFTLKNGARVLLAQVAVRRWKDGRVVAERFYYHQ